MYNYCKTEPVPVANIVNDEIKIDIDFLKQLYLFQTPSKTEHEGRFIKWLQKHIKSLYGKKVKTVIDAFGNLLITKGRAKLFPCVVSHVDIVHQYNPNLQLFNTDNIIFGFNSSTGEQCGIGADPKNGVYFNLLMLEHVKNIKCVFTIQEEIGMIGASKLDFSFFDDCTMLVQLDRRCSTQDVIEYTNGVEVLSEEFKKEALPYMKKYEYTFNDGSATDIGEIKKRGIKVVAMNIS